MDLIQWVSWLGDLPSTFSWKIKDINCAGVMQMQSSACVVCTPQLPFTADTYLLEQRSHWGAMQILLYKSLLVTSVMRVTSFLTYAFCLSLSLYKQKPFFFLTSFGVEFQKSSHYSQHLSTVSGQVQSEIISSVNKQVLFMHLEREYV